MIALMSSTCAVLSLVNSRELRRRKLNVYQFKDIGNEMGCSVFGDDFTVWKRGNIYDFQWEENARRYFLISEKRMSEYWNMPRKNGSRVILREYSHNIRIIKST